MTLICRSEKQPLATFGEPTWRRQVVRSACSASRAGYTIIELVVACGLLVSVMSISGTLVYRTDLVWRDTAKYRVSMNELSNQLEELTQLSPAELDARVNDLKLSKHCRELLPEATLTAVLVQDNLGKRIDLSLSWGAVVLEKRDGVGKVVRLSGWASDFREDDVSNDEFGKDKDSAS
jgi:hypothetical protein